MKINLLCFLISCSLVYCGNQSNPNKNNEQNSEIGTVDSFKYHFQILDSVVQRSPIDTFYHCCTQSIEFMEEKTEIEPSSPDGFFGRLYFTKIDLEKWHEWYEKSKQR